MVDFENNVRYTHHVWYMDSYTLAKYVHVQGSNFLFLFVKANKIQGGLDTCLITNNCDNVMLKLNVFSMQYIRND